MKIRVRFTKNECIKYLGHLDIMRAFQKCTNRANIRMGYSEGFNPHQKISFALPLGVGVTSSAEYMDAEVADGQDIDEIKEALQNASGPGFDILNVHRLKEGATKAMAAVRYAQFEVHTFDRNFSQEEIDRFLEKEEILCLKKTKKGEKTENIRPLILFLRVKEDCLTMRLTAGSENNVKPDLLLGALYEMVGTAYDRDNVSIERTELLGEGEISLDQMDIE